MNLPPSSGHRPAAAFTLIEMLITMAIFILLAAAVFGIITDVLQGASSLQDNQTHRDQVVALNDFMKKKLGEMPARSSLVSYRRGDGEGLDLNGIIFGQDDLFTAIDAKLQANGLYTLRLAIFSGSSSPELNPSQSFQQAVMSDDPSLKWAPLIHDVKTTSWKFRELNNPNWVDLWSNATSKPNLVEFSIQLAGDLQPVTMDFWIPHLEPVTPVTAP